MAFDVNQNRLTRRQAVTLIGASAIVPLGGRKGPTASLLPTSNKTRGDLYYTSLREVSRRIESRELSPAEPTRLMLERITKVDAQLKS